MHISNQNTFSFQPCFTSDFSENRFILKLSVIQHITKRATFKSYIRSNRHHSDFFCQKNQTNRLWQGGAVTLLLFGSSSRTMCEMRSNVRSQLKEDHKWLSWNILTHFPLLVKLLVLIRQSTCFMQIKELKYKIKLGYKYAITPRYQHLLTQCFLKTPDF